jgi:hypothetical protein
MTHFLVGRIFSNFDPAGEFAVLDKSCRFSSVGISKGLDSIDNAAENSALVQSRLGVQIVGQVCGHECAKALVARPVVCSFTSATRHIVVARLIRGLET